MSQSQMWRCAMCNAANAAVSRQCSACGYRSATVPSSQIQYAQQHQQAPITRTIPDADFGGNRSSSAASNQYGSGGGAPFLPTANPLRAMNSFDSGIPAASTTGSSTTPSASGITPPPQLPQQMPQRSVSGGGGFPPSSARTLGQSRGPSRVEEFHAQEQADFLRNVVQQSQQYGKDIESSIEHLADLLHKKTVECEGLRAIAQENYDHVRRSVRSEYEHRIRAEARQQQELRHLQSKIDAMVAERNQHQSEVQSLKALVKELEATPPHAAYNPRDNSLFNRVLNADDEGNMPKSLDEAAAAQRGLASWDLRKQFDPPKGAHRDFINYLSTIDTETATVLDNAGLFEFVKATAVQLCTPLHNGTHPDLSTVVTQLVRDRRSFGQKASSGVATQPIPTVEYDDRQRVTDLFLANNPGDFQKLNMLLASYDGRENELYETLREQYSTNADKEEIAKRLLAARANQHGADSASAGPEAGRSAPGASAGGGDSAVELHARIVLMYKKYNPSKLNGKELNELLGVYSPEVLLAALVEKYGPEPTPAERRQLIRSIVD